MNNKPNYNFSLRKLLITALAVGPLAVLPSPLWALPTSQSNLDAQVSAKSSGVSVVLTNANLVTVTSPDKGIIDWFNFGDTTALNTIAAGQTVNYVLPSSASAVLNRVIGSTATQVDGSIVSNGKVSILNPNGITISSGATVNVAGLTLSTISEPDATFAATGSLSLIGTAAGPVTTLGTANIQTIGGSGDVILAGTTVDVAGTVAAANLNIRSTGAVRLGQGAALAVNATAGAGGNVSVTSNGAAVTTGSSNAVTVQGNLIINSANPVSTTAGGAVTLSNFAAATTSVAGNLNVTTGGGATELAKAAATTISGNASINTAGAANTSVAGGAVTTTTAGGFVVNGSGKTTTIVAGGATNNTGANGAVTVDGNSNTITVVGGNTVITDANDITLGASTISGNLTVTSTAGSIANSGAVALTATTPSIALSATTANKSIAFTGTGAMTFTKLATDAATGTVTVSTTGDVTLPASGAATLAGKTVSVTTTAGKITGVSLAAADITSSGTFSGGGDVAFTGAVNVPTLSITSTGGKVTLGSTLDAGTSATISANGDLIVTGATGGVTATPTVSLTSTAGKITTGAITAGTSSTLSAAGDVTTGAIVSPTLSITSTNGKLTAGTITANTAASITTAGDIALAATSATGGLTLSTGGSVTQTGAITANGAGAVTSVTAGNLITLTNAANDFAIVGLNNATGGATITDVNAVTLGSSNLNGAATINAVGITLGSSSTDSIIAKSTLTLNSGTGAIASNANNLYIFGALGLNTNGATIAVNGLGNQFGQINIDTTGAGATAAGANASITESTTLNLGAVKTGTAGTLTATSANGNIVNSGILTVGGTTTLGAGSLAFPGDITVATSGNTLTGNVTITTAKNLTLLNNASTVLVTTFPVTGTATITQASGNFTANTVGSADFGTFGGTFAGNVTVLDDNDLTVKNLTVTGTGNVSLTASGAKSGGALKLDAGINIGTTGTTLFASGNKQAITDVVGGISVFGNVTFTSADALTINHAGNSFGAITATSGNNKAINLVEGGTMTIAGITNTQKAAVNLTSTSGDINVTGALVLSSDSSQNVTLTAQNGKVTASNVGNDFKGNVSIIAAGDIALAIKGNNDTTLGNISTNGKLTIDNTTNSGGGNKKISQNSGNTIKVFGDVTINNAPAGTQALTFDQSGNNFGAVTLTGIGGDNIKFQESGTLNIKSLTGAIAAGKSVALISENGDIVQPGGTGITLTGGLTAPLTLTASKGSISVSSSSNVFTAPVQLVTSGDATILNTTNLVLQGGTSIGGALSATITGANTISDNGSLTVNGNTTFTATAGAIQITDNNNRFGPVRFVAGLASTIVESGTFNLRAGSVATAPVTITTAGDFITSGTGGSSFTSTLNINAVGKITPSAGSLLVVGTFTVNANDTKDLSALSKSGNLANNDPVNLGAGTYIAPSN